MKTCLIVATALFALASAEQSDNEWKPIPDKRSVPNLGDDSGTYQQIVPTYSQNIHTLPIVQYRSVPIPIQQHVPVPIRIPVQVPSPVPVQIPVPVPVLRTIPLPVEHEVPYPVVRNVPVPVFRKVAYPVIKPIPVPVPVYKTKVIDHGYKHKYNYEEDW